MTIRALATSQDGAKQSSVVTRTFTVHKAEEGSDVDTASIASEGEQTVSETNKYPPGSVLWEEEPGDETS